MQYTKPMIELVYEIRKTVPAEFKPSVKLANPDLFNQLITHYHHGAKTITKALIKELLSFAGSDWTEALLEQKPIEEKHATKIYRGTISLERQQLAEEKARENRKKRIYRGRVIA